MKNISLKFIIVVNLLCAACFASAASINGEHLDGNSTAVGENYTSTTSNNEVSPVQNQSKPIILAEACCPAGYPWLRISTNRCFSSYSDCHDGNGGGWSCKQVDACYGPDLR